MADDFAKDVFEHTTGQNSMMNIIQHSKAIKSWYVDFQNSDPAALVTVQKDMSLARHRFNSYEKPLVVECLTWHATTRTAVRVHVERRGTSPGLTAKTHLEYFTDEIGMKRASFVGMLADFGVEGYDLNLYTDKTSRDSSLLPAAVSRYLAKVKVLFIDGKALEMGCTRVMLEAAKQVAVLVKYT